MGFTNRSDLSWDALHRSLTGQHPPPVVDPLAAADGGDGPAFSSGRTVITQGPGPRKPVRAPAGAFGGVCDAVRLSQVG